MAAYKQHRTKTNRLGVKPRQANLEQTVVFCKRNSNSRTLGSWRWTQDENQGPRHSPRDAMQQQNATTRGFASAQRIAQAIAKHRWPAKADGERALVGNASPMCKIT